MTDENEGCHHGTTLFAYLLFIAHAIQEKIKLMGTEVEIDVAEVWAAIQGFNPGWIGGITGVCALVVSSSASKRSKIVAIDAARSAASSKIRSLLEKFRSDEIKSALQRIENTPDKIRRLGDNFYHRAHPQSTQINSGTVTQSDVSQAPAKDLSELAGLLGKVMGCVRDTFEALPDHHRRKMKAAEVEVWKKDSKPLIIEIDEAMSCLFETRWELHKLGLLPMVGLYEKSCSEDSMADYLKNISRYASEGSPPLDLPGGNLIELSSRKSDYKNASPSD